MMDEQSPQLDANSRPGLRLGALAPALGVRQQSAPTCTLHVSRHPGGDAVRKSIPTGLRLKAQGRDSSTVALAKVEERATLGKVIEESSTPTGLRRPAMTAYNHGGVAAIRANVDWLKTQSRTACHGLKPSQAYALASFACLLLALVLCGCASTQPVYTGRHFDFSQDTFAYANELVWTYHYDENGKWVTHRR